MLLPERAKRKFNPIRSLAESADVKRARFYLLSARTSSTGEIFAREKIRDAMTMNGAALVVNADLKERFPNSPKISREHLVSGALLGKSLRGFL